VEFKIIIEPGMEIRHWDWLDDVSLAQKISLEDMTSDSVGVIGNGTRTKVLADGRMTVLMDGAV